MTMRPPVLRFALVLATFALGLTAFVGEARAETDGRLALGEVSAKVESTVADLAGVLRRAAFAELAALDMRGVTTTKHYVVSVSVVRLDRESTEKGSAATCIVSAVLRDAKRGALLVVLEAKARAEDVTKHLSDTETSAVRGAVRGALLRLPEALR